MVRNRSQLLNNSAEKPTSGKVCFKYQRIFQDFLLKFDKRWLTGLGIEEVWQCNHFPRAALTSVLCVPPASPRDTLLKSPVLQMLQQFLHFDPPSDQGWKELEKVTENVQLSASYVEFFRSFFLGKKKSQVDSRRPNPFLWFSSPFFTSMSLFHLSSTSYLHQDLQLIPFSPYTQKIQSHNASLYITAILLCYAGPNAPFLALLRFWNCLVLNQNEMLYHKPQSPSMHLPFLIFTFA